MDKKYLALQNKYSMKIFDRRSISFVQFGKISYQIQKTVPSANIPLLYTDVPEIEDAQGLKREAPPTTDKTHGPKWSMFWREPTNGT